MPDIDIIHNYDSGFEVDIGKSQREARGNKFLANRFEITLLTTIKQFRVGDEIITDTYGGNAQRFVGQRMSLKNPQSIVASMTLTIDETVTSILNAQTELTDQTERLVGATLNSLNVEGDTVYATIEIIPEAYEESYPLYYNLPLRGV